MGADGGLWGRVGGETSAVWGSSGFPEGCPHADARSLFRPDAVSSQKIILPNGHRFQQKKTLPNSVTRLLSGG